MEPRHMSYDLLEKITDGFSKERILGFGAFGVVYKVCWLHPLQGKNLCKNKQQSWHVNLIHIPNRDMKKMLYSMDLDDIAFHIEFENLTKLNHPNIVRLLGYCCETKQVPIQVEGKQIIAEKMYRALCFEYMHNGSLQKHLYEEHEGFDWQIRYRIVNGICEGLKYLHKELHSPVYHLDLKPDNILLDKDMEPKIADFGLSRLLGGENTVRTINPVGTLGYCPPEFIESKIISKEFDIFSFGVIIIKIICGAERYFQVRDMTESEFIENVQIKWRERLQASCGYTSTEIVCQPVKICLDIALQCISDKPSERPTIVDILNQLRKTENSNL